MKTKRTLLGVIFMIAFAVGMYAQSTYQNVRWGGITVKYPSTYKIEKDSDVDSYKLKLILSTEHDFSGIYYRILPDEDELIYMSPEEKEDLAMSILKDTDGEISSEEIISRGRIILYEYAGVDEEDEEVSASKTIKAKIDGTPIYGEVIVILANSKYVLISFFSDNESRLGELRRIVRQTKWE